MQLHRSFRLAELGPIKHGGAEIDHRGIQLPRSMLIGVGQSGARRSRGQPQMTKFPFAGSQSPTNFAPRLGVPQLTEEHGDELAPASETSSMTLRVVLAHG